MPRTRPLKTHLTLLFFLAVLVPVSMTAAAVYYHLSGETVAEVEQKNLTLARAVAGEVETFLLSPHYVLGNIRQLILHPHTRIVPTQAGGILDVHVSGATFGAHPETTLFESIYLIDPTGRVAAVGLPPSMDVHRQSFLGLDLSHQRFFSQTLETGTANWSDTFLSLISGHMSLALAAPVADRGVLVGNIDLKLLQAKVERFGRDTITRVAVVDREGTVVAHTDPAAAARKLNLGHLEAVRNALDGTGGTQRYTMDGNACLGSAAPVRGPGWAALVSQPTASAFAPIRHTAVIAGAVASIALVMGTALALMLAKRYAEPLSQLTAQARRAAAGEYDFPAVQGSYLEVDLLGRTFTEMLVALNSREAQLAEGERTYRELTELLPQVVFETNLEGNITYANRYGLTLFGVTPEDLATGLPVTRLIAPQDHARALENMRLRLRDEEAPSNEYDMVAADGRLLSVIVYTNPIMKEGRPVGLRGVLVDITRRRAVEDALRFTQFAMDHLSDAAYFCRQDGTLAYVNEAACTSLGYPRDELLALDIFALDPALRPAAWRDQWQSARASGTLKVTSHHRTRNGQTREVEVLVNHVVFGGEEYLCAVARDLAERRALEEQIRQSQKMEAVGTLASGIAHDFNNLLQAIAGYTELLLGTVREPRDRHRLQQVADAADSAARLVQQILTFSRRSTPNRRPIDLNDEVRHAAEMLRRTLPKMVQVEERLDPEAWQLSADPTQMEQILMNLGTNARDAMPQGGRLILETGNRRLGPREHSDLPAGSYVVLRVTDDGSGMDAKTRNRIFEPFFTTKGVGEGTGLGMSTVYGIVQAHGGHLHCDSTPGVGTTFSITLPAIPYTSHQPGDSGGHGAQLLPGGDERILVVDDEAAVRALAGNVLAECGYRVVLAENGEEALEHYGEALDEGGNGAAGRFQAVILDLGMPGMGGRRCLEELRRLDPEARVLVASGYGDPSLQEELLAAGATAFVAKPYRLQDLGDVLRGVLDAPRSASAAS